jgi:hypothetical protein
VPAARVAVEPEARRRPVGRRLAELPEFPRTVARVAPSRRVRAARRTRGRERAAPQALLSPRPAPGVKERQAHRNLVVAPLARAVPVVQSHPAVPRVPRRRQAVQVQTQEVCRRRDALAPERHRLPVARVGRVAVGQRALPAPVAMRKRMTGAVAVLLARARRTAARSQRSPRRSRSFCDAAVAERSANRIERPHRYLIGGAVFNFMRSCGPAACRRRVFWARAWPQA